MTPPRYTWDEIEQQLIGPLAGSDSIMTFGTIGSKNVEHDIDIIVTKHPQAPVSAFYRDVHATIRGIDAHLHEKHGAKAIAFTKLCSEDDTLYIGGYKPGDLALHMMSYVSLPQMSKDWAWALGLDESVDVILEEYNTLKGNKAQLYSEGFLRAHPNEHLILNLSNLDVMNAYYPKKQFLQKMNTAYGYIAKRLGMKYMPVKTSEEATNRFYEVCDILDTGKAKA